MGVKSIERPLSISELATNRLRETIINGDLKLGEAISEVGLAKSLNVSKTPVRHALAQMKTEGLVTIIPQKGTYVFTLSTSDLKEFCEHRLILETNAMRLSYERNRLRFCSSLASCAGKMGQHLENGKGLEYLRADIQFHDIIVKFADNRYLTESYKLIAAKAGALRTHLAARPLQTEKSLQEHLQIVDALEKGEPEAAIEVLNQHISRYARSYEEDSDDIAAIDRKNLIQKLIKEP